MSGNRSREKTFESDICVLEEIIKKNSEDPIPNHLIDHFVNMLKLSAISRDQNLIGQPQYGVYFREAFPLVLRHFLEFYREYKELTDKEDQKARKRKSIIEMEMEQGVCLFMQMVERDSQSMWNANRMINPVNPGFLPVSFVAPKLYDYYSRMLNDLAKIYRVEGGKELRRYAFCVSPIPDHRNRTIVLFEHRKNHGKVSLVNIPETEVASVNETRFVLMHEMFHIIPVEMRKRDIRYDMVNHIIIWSLSTYLSLGLENECDNLESLEVTLFYMLSFLDSRREWQDDNEEKKDKYTYSAQCRLEMEEKWTDILFDFTSPNWSDIEWAKRIKEYWDQINLNEKELIKDCMGHERFPAVLKSVVQKARKILAVNELTELIDILLNLLKEGFSDIFSILTLMTMPEEYIRIVDHGLQEAAEILTDEVGINFFRSWFISAGMCKISEEIISQYKFLMEKSECTKFLRSWKENTFYEKGAEISNYFKLYKKRKEIIERKSFPKGQKPQLIWQLISNTMVRENVVNYFLQCAQDWMIYQKAHEAEFLAFHKRFDITGPLLTGQKPEGRKTDIQILMRIAGA